jgi:hypothetical protein
MIFSSSFKFLPIDVQLLMDSFLKGYGISVLGLSYYKLGGLKQHKCISMALEARSLKPISLGLRSL